MCLTLCRSGFIRSAGYVAAAARLQRNGDERRGNPNKGNRPRGAIQVSGAFASLRFRPVPA